MDYASANGSGLKTHLKTHAKEKEFKCKFCDYASVRVGTLKIHLKTHSGEKSYNCNLCDYASARAWNLRTHLKIHSGIKTNKCNQCDFASMWAGTHILKTHAAQIQKFCSSFSESQTTYKLSLIMMIKTKKIERRFFHWSLR